MKKLIPLSLFLCPILALTLAASAADKSAAAPPAVVATVIAADQPAADPKQATKEQPWTNSLGMKFVPVPGTRALSCIWETRVQDYQAFADATGRPWEKPAFEQGPTHPAVNVSWEDAKAFCQWLTEKERSAGRLTAQQQYRLPTDAEWSIAVGLTGETDGMPKEKDAKIKNVYPWGNQWPAPRGAGNYGSRLNVDYYAHTSPVGSFTANQVGLYDLGGNVWEWCEDWSDSEQKHRVLRGGSWFNHAIDDMWSSYRDFLTPGGRYYGLGFRVVLVGVSSREAGVIPRP